MTSTTIFRVAHSEFVNQSSGTHFGPYATYGMPDDQPQIDTGISDQHPAPYMDDLCYLENEEVCGFESLDAYFAWFDDPADVERMRNCNFHLQVWQVPTMYVRFGRKQVAFVPTEGRIIDTMPL